MHHIHVAILATNEWRLPARKHHAEIKRIGPAVTLRLTL